MRANWVRTTVDVVISRSPVLLGSVIVTPDAAAVGDVTLYDGTSTGDPEIITVRTASGVSKTIAFTAPFATRRGLYVDVGSNVEEVLVQYFDLLA